MDIKEKYYNKDRAVNESAWLRRIMKISGYHGLSKLAVYLDEKILTEEKTGIMAGIIECLVQVFIKQSEGDETASQQIEIIWRLLFPEIYDIKRKDVEDAFKALDKHTPANLAQGFRIRRMIGFLSRAVQPVPPAKSVLTGKVKIAESDEWYKEEFRAASGAFERLEKDSVSLTDLAIEVLRRQDIHFKKKTPKYLKNRLKEVERWENELPVWARTINCSKPKDAKLPFGLKRKFITVCGGEETEHLLVCDFTEGWKKRREGSGKNNKTAQK